MSDTTDISAPSLQTLLSGLIDYAGLFPPAGLDMPQAAAAYAAELAGPDAWVLGRFVAPAARLADLARARALVGGGPQPWRVSVVCGADVAGDRARIAAIEAGRHGLAVEAVEVKASRVRDVDALAALVTETGTVFVEIPVDADVEVLLARMGEIGARAKIRTGGVMAGAFPDPDAVGRFLAAAVRADVPFKLTAGLHHPMRGEYPLSYDADADSATMYGYLNVLLATAALRGRLAGARIEALLVARDPSALVVGDKGIGWRDLWFPLDLLHETRVHHLVAFGSCSFREPLDELRSLAVRAA